MCVRLAVCVADGLYQHVRSYTSLVDLFVDVLRLHVKGPQHRLFACFVHPSHLVSWCAYQDNNRVFIYQL